MPIQKTRVIFIVLIVEQKWSDIDEGHGKRERLQSSDSEVIEETGGKSHKQLNVMFSYEIGF